MSALHSYSIGDHRCRVPVAQVWVTGSAAVARAKREYAATHGLSEGSVWAEANKCISGYIVKEGERHAP